jgi:hypothetical protein
VAPTDSRHQRAFACLTGPFSDVRLVVGLGNSGQAYAGHRHNVGFWCVRRLARDWSIRFKSSRLGRRRACSLLSLLGARWGPAQRKGAMRAGEASAGERVECVDR